MNYQRDVILLASKMDSIIHTLRGSGINPPLGFGPTIKPGEIIMGYPDEFGQTATSPEPEILRRNGTFVVIRKFHTRVSAFRKYLHEVASSPSEEELIAKMVGRWRSGAPLCSAPEDDDPGLGADRNRNNNFGYSDDMQGVKVSF